MVDAGQSWFQDHAGTERSPSHQLQCRLAGAAAGQVCHRTALLSGESSWCADAMVVFHEAASVLRSMVMGATVVRFMMHPQAVCI